jgi:Ankyrin repeats (3 copies)
MTRVSSDRIDELFKAVEAGDSTRVGSLLASYTDLAGARDSGGTTALHHAALHGHQAIVDLLLAAGADVNARDGRHHATPAGWAIEYLRVLHAIRTHDRSWARRLVTRHPALSGAVDREGKRLADHARECGDPDIARLFP